MMTPLSRREALKAAACGFGSLAFAGLAGEAMGASVHTLAAKLPRIAPRAKRVIFIFMQGGPSQVDTFDPKPRLAKEHGEALKFHNARHRKVQNEKLMASPWEFKQHGECGAPVSSLFPHMAKHVDDLCFIKSMHTEGVAHGPATLFMHTGATNLIRPSMGSWISYGLGTENRNLPAFMTISPPWTKGGPRNYGNAFLPAVYQGTIMGRAGQPASKAGVKHIRNTELSDAVQKKHLGLLSELNQAQLKANAGGFEMDAVLDSYELAYRMQVNASDLAELSGESKETLKMYGIGEEPTDDFGRQCLLARRLAERDVRFIQVNYADNGPTPRWDQHSKLKNHEKHAAATDQPVSALLQDLKARGLLEDTLVWWGGEFGRTPFSQNGDGRDHNPKGFTVWLAGAGVKPGFSYGATDEFGAEAVENRVHMHDLHATVLHLLGLDHELLTYRYAGRDFRLTDVYGHVVHDILT